MPELRPIPLEHLLARVLEEPGRQGSLFDLPLRKMWRPGGRDLSVEVHGRRAQTPIGPAAGPHAQLAQNIVLSWLAGARVIELKTVQILDELKIPRPCIDAATIGFNVEWSQELKLEDSLREYVTGWMLVRILRALDPVGLGEAARAAQPVFELSVGYDLAGLKAPRMRAYLAQCKDVGAIVDGLRPRLPAHLRDLDFPTEMVSCVTLSTFHGCPPDEIEAIARYLLEEHDVDVIVKLNPTLLGFDEVDQLLRGHLGYHALRPKRVAFEGDLRWEEAVGLGRRLAEAAARRGRRFGVKMTNTLVVENHKTYFAAEEMYLSGAPLHVLAMRCVAKWRAALGTQVPLSFSGGIDQHNVADAVACDLVPVTTCTDLLRPGGYGRMAKYLDNLEAEMARTGAEDRDAFILARFGKGAEAERLVRAELQAGGLTLDDAALRRRIVQTAGLLNADEVAQRVADDPRYAAGKNGKPPRKVGSTLVLFDCLSCDKCVPVCPNDANFEIPTPPEEVACEDVLVDADGQVRRAAGGVWAVTRPSQWANFADACNECGNCDVFCPEDGGPYLVKARFFGSRASFEAAPALDGIWVEAAGDGLRVEARLGGRRLVLEVPARGPAVLDDGVVRAEYDPASARLVAVALKDGARGPHRLDGAAFPTLRALVRGALDPARLGPVNAAVRVRWPAGEG